MNEVAGASGVGFAYHASILIGNGSVPAISQAQGVLQCVRASHLQSLRNPRQRHRRLLPQAPRDARLLPIGLRFLPQCFFQPSPPRQFFPHQPLGLFLLALLQLRSVVVGAPLLADLRQQLPPKRHLSQTATASHRRPDFPPALLPLPFLHPLLKHAPPRRAVLRNAVLAQEPVHSQPRRPPQGPLQILPVTAPAITP